MHRIIYLSAAKELLVAEEVNSLLQQSRKYNLENNITGVLFYIEGDFIQVLEGEKEIITTLFEKIKMDTRHSGIICVFYEAIQERQFPDWSMGFCNSKYKKLLKISPNQNLSRKKLFKATDKTIAVFLNTFIESHQNDIVIV